MPSIHQSLMMLFSQPTVKCVLRRGALYLRAPDMQAIRACQLERFNAVWRDAWSDLPFYRDWKSRHSLPDAIADLACLSDWPVVTKRELQTAGDALLRTRVRPSGFIRTGGATGEPLRLGSWPDGGVNGSSQWIGRAAYGYYPGIRTFLLWGHQHLYGKGLSRRMNAAKRRLKDRIANIRRISAYDLSAEAMSRAYGVYSRSCPEAVIGFSAAVLAFCRANAEHGTSAAHAPRYVLCTSGPLSPAECEEIASFFHSPVCMEYGSVECGVMAHTAPGCAGYRVFWDTHCIQSMPRDAECGQCIVTRLTPCYVPLIRYDIGDMIVAREPAHSHLALDEVRGRPSDIVRLDNGTAFFGALTGDCVKQVRVVLGHQLHVYRDGLRICVSSLRDLEESECALIQRRMRTVVPGLEGTRIDVRRVDALEMSVGGKVRLVIRHPDEAL